MARHHVLRGWALHGNEGTIENFCDLNVWKIRFHMRDILITHRGIDHQEKVIARIGDNQIIHDAASLIGKECIARFAIGQCAQSGWH